MKETWRAVVGFEGLYEVSDMGRVRGLDRVIGNGPGRAGQRLWRGKMLKQTVASHGYYEVSLCDDGTRTVRTVHSLVCEAFNGPAPTGHEVAHGNGRKRDCRASNLSWKTRTGNMADTLRHGTRRRGETAGASKLTNDSIDVVRLMRAAGAKHQLIADVVGCSRRNVGRILDGTLWSHV